MSQYFIFYQFFANILKYILFNITKRNKESLLDLFIKNPIKKYNYLSKNF